MKFQKAAPEGEQAQFGRSAIGRLDQSFLEYLETVDIAGFDKQELIKRAMKYLGTEE